MADHIVRCMTPPPSLSGLTTDTSRGYSGDTRRYPTAPSLLRLGLYRASLRSDSLLCHTMRPRPRDVIPHLGEALRAACRSGNLALCWSLDVLVGFPYTTVCSHCQEKYMMPQGQCRILVISSCLSDFNQTRGIRHKEERIDHGHAK